MQELVVLDPAFFLYAATLHEGDDGHAAAETGGPDQEEGGGEFREGNLGRDGFGAHAGFIQEAGAGSKEKRQRFLLPKGGKTTKYEGALERCGKQGHRLMTSAKSPLVRA
ncbi:hypothetical protein GMLC_19540 [Geomonas limicola]|uniref:Uncharacterized protein n=1 Tax=Geomonas limicola TaxID=2740186 RepID=A0A6V8N716_9BACT|nr:hypothetical protein GMLC_19540 [Geomonas limicola]